MPFLIENIIATVIWLIVIGLVIIAGFVAMALARRANRNRYFGDLERARARVAVKMQAAYTGTVSIEEACRAASEFRTRPEKDALEQYLLRHSEGTTETDVSRRIALQLGWIDQWIAAVRCAVPHPTGEVQRVLHEVGDDYKPEAGLRGLVLRLRNPFVLRCRAAGKLASLPTPQGLLALIAATQDPHVEVQEVCVRYIARLKDPFTIPVLVAEMIDVLTGRSQLSVRVLKTSLVKFSLDDADAFLPALRHENHRVRFFATDIVREMADREAEMEVVSKGNFSPTMYRVFTRVLWRDSEADVRGRCALVLRYFNDDTSQEILKILLKDETWFVRMYACRACGHKYAIAMARFVAEHMTDSNWMVREAAVRSLRNMGNAGIEEALRVFVEITDRYAGEQIADEVQRGGMLTEMLADLETPKARQRIQGVARKMLELGKVVMLCNYVLSDVDRELKLLLIPEMIGYPACHDVLGECAESDPDDSVRASATSALRVSMGASAAGAGAGT